MTKEEIESVSHLTHIEPILTPELQQLRADLYDDIAQMKIPAKIALVLVDEVVEYRELMRDLRHLYLLGMSQAAQAKIREHLGLIE
jgi:hypothetical protein